MATNKKIKDTILDVNNLRTKVFDESKTKMLQNMDLTLKNSKEEQKAGWAKIMSELEQYHIEKIKELDKFSYKEAVAEERDIEKLKLRREALVRDIIAKYKDTGAEIIKFISKHRDMKEYEDVFAKFLQLAKDHKFDVLKGLATKVTEDNQKKGTKKHPTLGAVCMGLRDRILEHQFYLYLLEKIVEGNHSVEDMLTLFKKEFSELKKRADVLASVGKKEAFSIIKRFEDLELLLPQNK